MNKNESVKCVKCGQEFFDAVNMLYIGTFQTCARCTDQSLSVPHTCSGYIEITKEGVFFESDPTCSKCSRLCDDLHHLVNANIHTEIGLVGIRRKRNRNEKTK